MERGNSLVEIIESVASKGIFPSEMFETFEAEGKYRNLTSRLREFVSTAGRAVVGRSMAAICNLKNCDARPDTVICDAMLISKCISPTLLTFIEDKEDSEGHNTSGAASNAEGMDDSEEERKYNKSISKALIYARYFTDEPFDVIYGVITSEDIKTTEAFNTRLSKLKEETSTFSIGSNLLMSEERCLKIHKAFIMMSALTDIRSLVTADEDTDRESHYVMSVAMHRKLMLHIDSIFHGINEPYIDETLNSLLNERISKTGKWVVDRWKSETVYDVNTDDQYELKDLPSDRDKGEYTRHNTECFSVIEGSAKNSSLTDIVVFRHYGFSHVIVTDTPNMAVRRIRFSLNHGVTKSESTTLPGKPWGLTKIDCHDVMVTIPHKMLVSVLTVEPELQKCEDFSTDKKYFGITYLGSNRIAACAQSTVDILAFTLHDNLTLLKTMPDLSNMLFKVPKYISFSQDGDVVVGDVSNNTITKVSLAGDCIFQCKEAQCPRGVAVDSKGDIFFADYSLNNVTNIGNDGAKQEEIWSDVDSVRGPVAVCFDQYDCLYLAMKNNMITVFESAL